MTAFNTLSTPRAAGMGATTRSPEQPPAEFTTVAREQLPWLYSLTRRLVGEEDFDDRRHTTR